MLKSAVNEEKKFKQSDFIYIFSWFNKCISLQVRGRQPQETKCWCQQKPLVTSVICYKFQKISLKSDFIQFFFKYVFSPKAGADNPLGTNFLCQQEHLVTLGICCKFQKNLFEVWFYTIFFVILYMYIAPGQGETASWGQSFDVNRNVLSLHSFVASLKKMSLKSDFIQFFSWFNTCI